MNNQKRILVHVLMVAAFLLAFTAVLTSARADDWGRNDRHQYQHHVEQYNDHGPRIYETDAYYYRPTEFYDPVVLDVTPDNDWPHHHKKMHKARYLSPYVRVYEPSPAVVELLPPARHGLRYVQLDRKNLYLVSEITREIVREFVIR